MSLQKYIDAAKEMSMAERGTIGWLKAANVFRDMGYVEIASLMIEADAELTRLYQLVTKLQKYAAIAVANDAFSDAYKDACPDAMAEVYLARRQIQKIVRRNLQPTETE
jgi:hypothetical protein